MENRAHALAAGIFTLVLTIATALAVWWFAGNREATKDYVLVSSRSVTGLNIEATVRYRGIRAGKVRDIELDPQDPRNILVWIEIAEDIPITKGTTARLATQGVTGIAYIQLEDSGNNAEPLTAPAGELARIPMTGSSAEALTDSATDVLAQARDLLSRVNSLVDEHNVERIAATIKNLESASAGLDRGARDLAPLIASARRIFNDKNVDRVQAILANVEKASGQAAPLANELRALVGTLQAAAQRLEALGGGATGQLVGATLPRVNALLNDLASASRQLTRVLTELESAPESLVFGRSPPRPGPGEAGFQPPR